MEQSHGSESVDPCQVCFLKRSIYGLKQALRSWNIHFDHEIKEFGYMRNSDEPCVYKKASGSNVMFLVLYVDDILIMSNNVYMMSTKSRLSRAFSMKDLGDVTYILGIRLYKDRVKKLIVFPRAFTQRKCQRFSILNSKKGQLHVQTRIHLSKGMSPNTFKERDRMSKVHYALMVRSLMYAMIYTRPNILYPMNVVSQYQSDINNSHQMAIKHILKYLRMTKDLLLIYGRGDSYVD